MSDITEAADRLEVALADGDCIAGRDVRMWASVADLRTVIAAARGARSEREWYDLKAERDTLAAVIEGVKEALDEPSDERGVTWWEWIEDGLGGTLHDDLREILSTAGTASILRERYAEKWDEGAVAEANRWLKVPVNPYREDA